MIDMHTHILPNVDDGADSIECALKMIEMEKDCGCDIVYLTPHMHSKHLSNDFVQSIKESFVSFKEKVSDIQVLLGSEIYFSKELYNALDEGKVITMDNTEYLLIEFNLLFKEYDIEEVVYNLCAKGYKPIIAHIERYPYLSMNDIKKIIDDGGLLQINSLSLLKSSGRRMYKRTKELLKKGYVSYIASDCHNINKRCPNLNMVSKFSNKYKINMGKKL